MAFHVDTGRSMSGFFMSEPFYENYVELAAGRFFTRR